MRGSSVRRRRRGGWRQKKNRIQAYVRLHKGAGGLRTQSFPINTSTRALQDWIDETALDYRRRHPRGVVGTLSRDVELYVKLLVNRPQLQAARAHQLAWWCTRFGHRSRWSLTPIELETALNELLAEGYAASTVKKYRTALFNLFTKIDGHNASNPMRDVPPPREPDPMLRALPYSLIEQIFAAMPDRRYVRKLSDGQAAMIRAQALRPGATFSAIARAFGISGTMVRKIARGMATRYDSASKAKARLLVMAYTGLPQALIMQLRPEDIDLVGATVLAHGRSKGGGTRPARLPLTPKAVAALRAFVAADAFGPFDHQPLLQAFKRAARVVATRSDLDDASRQQLLKARPYDLRHSFLTEVQLAGGNIRATQALAMHADIKQTQRYTLAAVTPEMRAAAAALAASIDFRSEAV